VIEFQWQKSYADLLYTTSEVTAQYGGKKLKTTCSTTYANKVMRYQAFNLFICRFVSKIRLTQKITSKFG